MSSRLSSLGFVLCFFALAACGPPATLATVQTEVFDKSCTFAACHKGAGAGGLNLEAPSWGRLVSVNARGPGAAGLMLVVPGKPDESYLLQKLTHDAPVAGVRMPQGGDPLAADRLQLVHDWIAAGAKER